MQLIISALLSRGGGVGDALSPILPAHIVAPPPHLPDEVLPAPHPFHDILHCGDQLEFPAFSPDGGPVFSRLYALLAPFLPIWLQRGQAMFPADLVADHPHPFQGPGREVELSPGIRLDGVDDEVGVKVLRVQVCRHQNLTSRKELLRQLQCDPVSLRRSDPFLRRKGLDVLVKECVMRLAIQILGSHEALIGNIGHAVHAREVAGPILIQGFFALGHIAHDAFHRPGCLLGLFDEATCCHGRSPGPLPSGGH